jgi:hypothetical protein
MPGDGAMPTLKVYNVTMKDGSRIAVKAYSHQHSLAMAEAKASASNLKGNARIAVTSIAVAIDKK